MRTPTTRAAEATGDVGCRVPRERLVDVGDGDGGAGFGEAERDRLAEPTATAGDEGAAAGEREEVADGRCRDVGEGEAHAGTSAGSALRCATWPSQARLGFGVRSKVSRSTAMRPKVGSQWPHSKLSSSDQCR